MKSEKGDVLYNCFFAINSEPALKCGLPGGIPYDDNYKKSANDFFDPFGVIPYPEVHNKKG